MFKKGVLFLMCWLTSSVLIAQDPQYSQFYAAPLFLNPAFTGSSKALRMTLNYRNQWPSLSANFTTSTFAGDYYVNSLRSGVGLMVTTDNQFTNLKTTDLSALYSYHLKINEGLAINLGLQGGYVNRSVSFFDLTFGDQLTNRGPNGQLSLDPISTLGPQINFLDFSTGALVYGDQFWVGASFHHINQPNQSLTGQDARLPMKIGIQAGYKIPLGDYEIGNGLGSEFDKEKSISPAILYKKQGLYLTYSPLVFGVWYRGLPIKKYVDGVNNHDAMVFLLGYRQENFSVGYSYDATISSLGAATGGSHEISLTYIFDIERVARPNYRRRKKELSCPKF
jgi:type IX secretion system PorP/SprF family membrane protein